MRRRWSRSARCARREIPDRGGGQIAFGASEFRDTILGEATEAAVKQTVEPLIAATSRLE